MSSLSIWHALAPDLGSLNAMSEFSPCFEEILEISTINGSHVPHGRWQPESFYLAKQSCFIFSKFSRTYWQSRIPVLITVFLLAQLTYVLPLQQYKTCCKIHAHTAHTRQLTHTAHYTEAYLITILLIVQPVGVAREGGVRKRDKEREAGKEPEAAWERERGSTDAR